ncbi:succinylglutamate desuccinylase [Motilimonas sp. E26]|uniref:succinylglutamate desuccinylase n=1 Tax=Motilimonas sp. E26 TaxID=2865674 RepID=UPI001E60F269|nr:succinylglutamate desuccinylase [Motilimonas sp. E26]
MMDFIDYTLGRCEAAEFLASNTSGIRVECWAPGVLYLDGNGPRSLILSAGIHGDETAPIIIINQLIKRVFLGELEVVNPCLFILGNPDAIELGVRYLDTNLNRLFCGAHRSIEPCKEAARADLLERCVERFYTIHQDTDKLHWDCHCAIRGSVYNTFAIVPIVTHELSLLSHIDELQHAGIQAAVLSQLATNTFSYASFQQFKAQAATLELGKALPWHENKMSDHQKLVCYLIRLLAHVEDEDETIAKDALIIYQIAQQIVKTQADFSFNFSAEVDNFTPYQQGTLLAQEAGAEYHVQAERELILFPNANVELGARALLTLTPCSL